MASLADNKVCVNIFPLLISSVLVRGLGGKPETAPGSLVQKGKFEKDVEGSESLGGWRVGLGK